MTPNPDSPTASSPDPNAGESLTRSAPPPASGSQLGTASADAVRALEAFKHGLTAPPPAELDPPPGFVVEKELGYGGMGAVYLARQLGLNRPVALKLVKSTQAIEAKALIRFLAEAEAVAAVRHPNVVEVFQYGEHNGRPYLALEYCPGGDLTALSKSDRTRDAAWFRRVAGLMAGVADGVQAAHALGIVHRDLKPANVLLAADGTPKVADFGLAKRGLGSDLTHTGAVLGTPAYMSPEQAKGDTKFVGPEADVWALGVMLYELCCGERPTDTSGPVMDAIARVANGDVPPLRAKLPAVPNDLAQVIHKCLSADPRDRYPTAAGLASDLRNWLDGRPISVRPMSTVARVWRWSRRNPLATGLIAALISVLIAGLGLLQQNAVIARLEQERVNAEAKQRTAELAGELADQREQARMRSLQDGHLIRAALASQRGAAREAVAAYDAAAAAGATLTDEQRIDRIQNVFWLVDPVRWAELEAMRQAEVEALDPAALSPALRGRWHVFNGLNQIGRDEEKATAELTRAIELLPPDSWGGPFVRGMLEPDVEKALTLFEQAIERNPTALDPRHMQMFILFMHGRFAEVLDRAREVRALAPDHPQTTLLSFMAHSARGEKAEAKRVATVLRKQFPRDAVDALEVIGPGLLGANVERGTSGLLSNRDFLMFLADGGVPKLRGAIALLNGGDAGGEGMFRRSPRCLQPILKLLGCSVRNLLGDLNGTIPLKTLTSRDAAYLLTPAQFEELKGYASSSPEGFVRWWYAGELVVRNKHVNSDGFKTRDRKVLAPEAVAVAEQYEAAYRAKGFLFDARRMSLEGAILYYTVAALGVYGSDPDDTDPAVAKRAAVLLRDWLTDPRVRDADLQFLNVQVQVRLALVAGERGLAQALLDRAEKRNPHDWSLPIARAYVSFGVGNWETARMNAMMVLEDNPEDPHMLRIFRQSTEKLQQLGKAGY